MMKQQQSKPKTQNAQMVRIKIIQMLKYCQVQPQSIEQLPESFLEFMQNRGLQLQELTIPIPRYIRVKPKYQISHQQLAHSLKLSCEQIVRVDDSFWAVNPNCKISQSNLYELGIMYGMDYSSSIPVRCLDLSAKMTVLQICSAPGNKSMLMADLYQQISIMGIEINPNRANVMKNLIKKYGLQKQIQILVTDGLTFNSQRLFDRVLVDAECTHEGSLKHIYKFFRQTGEKKPMKGELKLSKQQQKQFKKNNCNPYTSEIKTCNSWTKQDFEQRFLDAYKLSNLTKLQFGLLQNGYRLLRPGGILVYSTCSFDQQQNQQIVQKLLKKQQTTQVLNAGENLVSGVSWSEGKIKGTIRLTPSVSLCGGMFVCKIRKSEL